MWRCWELCGGSPSLSASFVKLWVSRVPAESLCQYRSVSGEGCSVTSFLHRTVFVSLLLLSVFEGLLLTCVPSIRVTLGDNKNPAPQYLSMGLLRHSTHFLLGVR